MASEGHTQDRIDQKVVAALVNRFIADSASFLQDFAQQCEVKMLALNQRLQRLERLIELFEKKVECLEPADGPIGRLAPARAGPIEDRGNGSLGVQAIEADIADDVPDVSLTESTPPDERYEKYQKMMKVGLNPLAIRQKFMLDMSEDPSLDQSVLDKIVGEDTNLPQIKPSRPTPKPQPVAPKPEPTVDDVVHVDVTLPDAAEDSPEPAPASSGPLDMNAEILRKHREREERKQQGQPSQTSTAPKNSGDGTAPIPTPKKSPSPSPPLFAKKPAPSVPHNLEPVTKNVSEVSQEPPVSEPSEIAPLFKTPSVPSQPSASPQGPPVTPEITQLFKTPSVPSKPPASPQGPLVTPKVPSLPNKPLVPATKSSKSAIQKKLQARRDVLDDSGSDKSDF